MVIKKHDLKINMLKKISYMSYMVIFLNHIRHIRAFNFLKKYYFVSVFFR